MRFLLCRQVSESLGLSKHGIPPTAAHYKVDLIQEALAAPDVEPSASTALVKGYLVPLLGIGKFTRHFTISMHISDYLTRQYAFSNNLFQVKAKKAVMWNTENTLPKLKTKKRLKK